MALTLRPPLGPVGSGGARGEDATEGLRSLLTGHPLFEGVEGADFPALLDCLGAGKRDFSKGAFIFTAGEDVLRVGLVLSGGVAVIKEDAWGNRTILARLEPGELFGEAFSCSTQKSLTVSVVAEEPCRILFLDFRGALALPDRPALRKLVRNMLRILADKNVMLTQRIEALARRTIREKLSAYLSDQARRAGRNVFDVPFDRQALADYLCVDRSALSRELGRMRDEGLLIYRKNRFTLH